jgi:hypothetical protein
MFDLSWSMKRTSSGLKILSSMVEFLSSGGLGFSISYYFCEVGEPPAAFYMLAVPSKVTATLVSAFYFCLLTRS